MCYFKVPLRRNLISKFDCLLKKALFSYANEPLQGKTVICIVVEPNAATIEELKYNVALQDDIFRKVKFNWANQRMEEFIEDKEPEHYDFIHFVHALYYVEKEEEILKNAHEKFLASPGYILAAVVSKDNIWVHLVESFNAKIATIIDTNSANKC